jgi:hypothetical protein
MIQQVQWQVLSSHCALGRLVAGLVGVPEAVEDAQEFRVVEVVLEEHPLHLEERRRGQQAIATRLMLRPDALHLQPAQEKKSEGEQSAGHNGDA